jgi:hypothetical protein
LTDKDLEHDIWDVEAGVAHHHVCKSEGGDEVPRLGFLRCLSLVEIGSVGWLKNTLIWSPRVSPHGDIEKGDWGAQKWYVPDDK